MKIIILRKNTGLNKIQMFEDPDFMEFSEQTFKKIILGEIDNGNNS